MFGDDEFIIGYNPDAFARLLGLPKDEEPAAGEDEAGECAAGFEVPAPGS
jgi:hypothetical protein